MTAGTAMDPAALEQVAARVDEQRRRHGIAGAAVAVCTSAGPVWSASSGVADEHGRPIGDHTRRSLLAGDAATTVFHLRKRGRSFGTATLTSAGDLGTFTFRDEPPVRVEQVRPRRWFTAHGEVLDLKGPRPSYANIPLTRA
jgi:hypothetical protein